MPKRKLSAEEKEDRSQKRNKKRRETYVAKKRSLASDKEDTAEDSTRKTRNKRRREAYHLKRGQFSHQHKETTLAQGENFPEEKNTAVVPLTLSSIEEERKMRKNEKRRQARARTKQLFTCEKIATSAGSATLRLKACLQQICDSTDSASSPSVQLAAIEIKECAEKLNELPEFNEDPALWAQAYSILGGAKQRAMFMACPDNLKTYHWISQELNRVQIAELGASNWFAPAP